jgi:hypothetical protein
MMGQVTACSPLSASDAFAGARVRAIRLLTLSLQFGNIFLQ